VAGPGLWSRPASRRGIAGGSGLKSGYGSGPTGNSKCWEKEDGTNLAREFPQARYEGLQGMGNVLHCCTPPGG
jgi:hypothetical protein